MSSSTGSTSNESSVIINADLAIAGGTAVGVDIGVKNVLALAPRNAGTEIEESCVIQEPRLRAYYKTLLNRPTKHADRVDGIIKERLNCILDDIVDSAVSYAQTFDTPILVLEDLPYSTLELCDSLMTASDPACWLLPTVSDRLVEHATEAGIPVIKTSPKYTTQQCHICGDLASVGDDTITCTTPSCSVGSVCRDRSAAVSIAKHLDHRNR